MIIAEIGSVHDGSLGNALKAVELAAEVGATAVKFQTHLAEFETLETAPSPSYFSDESRYEYFQRTSFSLNEWKKIKQKAVDEKIQFISSPFSLEAVDLLEEVGMDIYKIPSGEVSNIPLLEKIAYLKKTVLLSTGMSNWDEIDEAYKILKKHNSQVIVMQCSSIYPCPPKEVGINVIQELKARYNTKIGFSDHTSKYAASICAAYLGADVIEKHLTFSKKMYGSDAKHSLEPNEFKEFAVEVQDAWHMRKFNVDKNDISKYLSMKNIFEKSIVYSRDLKAGHIIAFSDLGFKKPGNGFKPNTYKSLLGKKLIKQVRYNDVVDDKDFS